MTPIIVTYSPEAERRMPQRHITRQMVRTVLAVGIDEPARGERRTRRAYVGTRELVVPYVWVGKGRLHVVTAYWRTRKPRRERVSYRGEEA